MSEVVKQDRSSGARAAACNVESAHQQGDRAGRPSGPAAAVVFAAGLACFALGLLTVLTAASAAISSALTVSARVGDLSGVTTVTAIVFFGSWALLGLIWRKADPPLMRVAAVTAALTLLGVLGTFPPLVELIVD
jgi:cytochrome c biogenesis protein CcdA